MLGVRFDQIHELFRAGNTRPWRSSVTVVLAASVAAAQSIGSAIDPASDLDEARTLRKVCAFYEAQRKDMAFGASELGLLQNTTAFDSESAMFPPRCGGRKEQKAPEVTVAVRAWWTAAAAGSPTP